MFEWANNARRLLYRRLEVMYAPVPEAPRVPQRLLEIFGAFSSSAVPRSRTARRTTIVENSPFSTGLSKRPRQCEKLTGKEAMVVSAGARGDSELAFDSVLVMGLPYPDARCFALISACPVQRCRSDLVRTCPLKTVNVSARKQ